MEKEIARFNKNATEEIVIRILEQHGLDLVDIRVFVSSVIPSDGFIATKKGICMRKERIPNLQNALKKAEEEFQKRKQVEKK